MNPGRVVVAGGGLAALRTAEELRARGYQGQVTILAAEPRPPYDRPPLSKQVLMAPPDAEPDTTLKADVDALGIDLHLGEAVTGAEIAVQPGGGAAGKTAGEAAGSSPAELRGTVRTARGTYPFGCLVAATGAVPVRLPGTGRQRVLRTHDDAMALRGLLRPGLRLAVVGAGWIGAELATAAAAHGCRVTVVEAAAAPLAAAVGAEVGNRTARWYAETGVDLRTCQAVESVADGGLVLPGGGWLAADEVVTAVGVRPCVDWLAGSGVRLEDGVAADEGMRASVPGVYAVGDCASFVSRRFSRRLRFEHWDVALHAPEVAAANILGGDEVYDPVPYFWSEQFGRMVQYAGYHGAADRLTWRGDPDGGRWAACWLSGERLAAILTVDSPRDLVQGRRLIASGTPVDEGLLADPAVPVRNATAA
ncbi:MAG TPA: FAD-dependent oxidoreductase [Streptosporangiaceae bacterium]|nr:FAD-dependent oxidoreductase [Streptosporangiaceae bacterium]